MHYLENLILGNLNINSIRSKFSAFKEFIQRKRLPSETKLVEYFLNSQIFAEVSGCFHKISNRWGGTNSLYNRKHL